MKSTMKDHLPHRVIPYFCLSKERPYLAIALFQKNQISKCTKMCAFKLKCAHFTQNAPKCTHFTQNAHILLKMHQNTCILLKMHTFYSKCTKMNAFYSKCTKILDFQWELTFSFKILMGAVRSLSLCIGK